MTTMATTFHNPPGKRLQGTRYVLPEGPEVEFQAGSRGRVLRNLCGITSKRLMDHMEFDALVTAQEVYLTRIRPDTRFTAALIRNMHKDWLGRLYEWAGTYRTVELAKMGFSWPPACMVGRNMEAFEHKVLIVKTPCRAGAIERVTCDMAEVHAELLLIHPFREGNGRLARWVAELMALQAGCPLPRYRFTGRGAKKEGIRYLSAVKAGYCRNYLPLADFFAEAIERGRA